MNALKRRGLRKEGGDKIGELRKGGFIRISAAGEAGKGLRGAYPQQGVYVVRLQDDDGKAFGRAGGRDYPQGIDQRAEKFLLELRYFRRKSRLKQFCGETDFKEIGSERNYYRRQAKLLKKVSGALQAQGLTKETFFSDHARFDWLMSVYRFIEAGKEGRNAAKEHSLVEFLYGKSTGPTFRELWKKGKKRDG